MQINELPWMNEYTADPFHSVRIGNTQVATVDTKRLFWGSRRGMLELDLILLPFLENVYPSLAQSDKEDYWKLLESEDQDLFAWFLKRDDPQDSSLQRIVEIVRENTGLKQEP